MSSSLTLGQVAENALREKAEVEAQNKYLQKQLGKLLEETRRGLRNSRSPTDQEVRCRLEEEGTIPMAPLVREKKKEGHSGLEEVITLTTLRLIFSNLKVIWTRIFFLIGYARLKGSLITRRSRRRRKSSLWHLSSASIPQFGGLILWPRELEKGRTRSALGIK